MSERKYKQRGYQDTGKPERKERPPAPTGGPPRQEHIGPRTPRMVARVTRARCANCGTVLPPGFDPNGQCPRCQFELHSCKQCIHFDTGAQFECTEPIPERIPRKDAKNECTFFAFRMLMEKDTSPASAAVKPVVTPGAGLTTDSARRAFDNLFKK
jgi:hypothetical protein